MGSRRLHRLTSLVFVLGLVAASCSSKGTTTTQSPGGSESPGVKATGTPIFAGMINQENTPAGSFPENSAAAKAAVDYINNELGGVEGHPIELEVCQSSGTPESSGACANKLVAKKPMWIMEGEDFGTSASVPIVEQAGVPYVGGIPILPAEYTSKNAFFFQGGSAAAFPAQAVYIAKNLHATKVSILHTDVPAGLAAAQIFSQGPLVKLGVTAANIKLVPMAPDASDFTPAVTAANANSPDVIMVLAAAQACSRIMQAKQSLGVQAAMFYPGSCNDNTVISAGGSGAEGAYFNHEAVLYTDTSDPEVKIFLDKLKKYAGSDAVVSGYAQYSFADIMDIYELMKEIGYANLTPASLKAQLQSTKDHHNFMRHPYTCDGAQVAGLPAVCNSYVRIIQYSGGQVKDLLGDWVSGADLLGA